MPLYEYQCQACGHRFERLVRTASAATVARCAQCDDPRVEKLFSSFGVSTGGGDSAEPSQPFCGRCGENRPPCSGSDSA